MSQKLLIIPELIKAAKVVKTMMDGKKKRRERKTVGKRCNGS